MNHRGTDRSTHRVPSSQVQLKQAQTCILEILRVLQQVKGVGIIFASMQQHQCSGGRVPQVELGEICMDLFDQFLVPRRSTFDVNQCRRDGSEQACDLCGVGRIELNGLQTGLDQMGGGFVECLTWIVGEWVVMDR